MINSYCILLLVLTPASQFEQRRFATAARLNRFVAVIPVRFAGNAEICQYYAVQFARMKAAGTLIGANDLWIAVHALACGAVLVTNNTREFARIEGLSVENWAG